MLVVKKLCKSFHGKPVLKNISFEQPLGSIGVFIGASGSGKSTLFRVLNNLESWDSGEIFLEDQKLDPDILHKKHLMTLVFQGSESFNNLTVLENVAVGLRYSQKKSKEASNAIAWALLEKYHLKAHAQCYPSQLSGGQKQRLAIARATAIQPKIICMDEPTSALDSSLRAELIAHLHALKNEGYIVLLSSHDMSFVENLDAKIYHLKNGDLS
jgi:polar amino acid transport system ATP-binding protein